MKKSRVKQIFLWLIAVLMISGAVLLAGCGNSGKNAADSSAASAEEPVSVSAADSADQGSEVSASASFLSEADMSSASEFEAENEAAAPSASEFEAESEAEQEEAVLDEDGSYTSKEDVALYLYLYGHLPDNYITKKEAEKLGWDNHAGNLQDVAPGKSIGGTRFGNYEGLLPDKKGRTWYECDINYEGGYRGGERIVYSDDGLIYYTGDHYKSFEQLY